MNKREVLVGHPRLSTGTWGFSGSTPLGFPKFVWHMVSTRPSEADAARSLGQVFDRNVVFHDNAFDFQRSGCEWHIFQESFRKTSVRKKR